VVECVNASRRRQARRDNRLDQLFQKLVPLGTQVRVHRPVQLASAPCRAPEFREYIDHIERVAAHSAREEALGLVEVDGPSVDLEALTAR